MAESMGAVLATLAIIDPERLARILDLYTRLPAPRAEDGGWTADLATVDVYAELRKTFAPEPDRA